MKNIALSGNNLGNLDVQAAETVGLKGTTLYRMQNEVHRVGEDRIPTARDSAWERELSLGRGAKQHRGGNMATRVKVKSNSHRSKTDIIDGVILHFDKDGWASIPELEAYKIEAYMAKRPGRLQLVREQVTTINDLLAEAVAASTAAAPAPEAVEEVPALPEAPSEEEAVKELGLDLSQVEDEDVPPTNQETRKPKKKATKKE